MLRRLPSHSRRLPLALLAAILVGQRSGAKDTPPELLAPELIEPAADQKSGQLDGAESPESSATAARKPEDDPLDRASPLDRAGLERLHSAVRESHPWARFSPGAWRRLRVTSQSFEEDGVVATSSTAERTERLVTVDQDSYTIETDNQLPLGDQSAAAPTVSRKLWLLTDRSVETGEPLAVSMAPSSISLANTVAPCEAWTVVTPSEGSTEQQTLSLAEGIVPTLLRREAVTTQGGVPGPAMVQSVSRTDLPASYQGELVSSWRLTTTVEHPDGARTVGEAVASLAVPGGIHSETATEYDSDGHRVRWVVTELLESGLKPQAEGAPESDASPPPGVSIEVRPRKFLRILRRQQREPDPDI